MTPRSAIKTDLFDDERHRKRITWAPQVEIEPDIGFAGMAAGADRVALRPVSPQGGHPPFPTETRVCTLVLKGQCNLADEHAAR